MKKFDCVFENDNRGIFMEVDNMNTHVEFSTYLEFEHKVSICLRDKEVDELIKLLQQFKNRKTQ